ncbi:succinate dehydrogenase assembly factor 4, mitochondrial-like [Homalodisca vitripennis]|uniref:succinate dehydrogenase assembly factor 4, mitochondrial-like n=1 Tax=Homalodisca vitripennis TaxID=197043 RepID=UPI001EEBA8E9|nr:succinate dehydrogenase assembly factor 4, mitochondrial-like [Homalodisca vitripennis]XP_046673029.1 succinate dehydrogenase assembly factor 4, mitochondrial-like [Homalodisca vitripennis]
MSRLQHLFIKSIRAQSFGSSHFQSYSTATTSNLGNKDEETACEKTDKLSKKLRAKTPIGKLDELDVGKHPYQEKEPLPEWPNNTNPNTGEVGGPRGPEPTRYGDWERKGRVSDF